MPSVAAGFGASRLVPPFPRSDPITDKRINETNSPLKVLPFRLIDFPFLVVNRSGQ